MCDKRSRPVSLCDKKQVVIFCEEILQYQKMPQILHLHYAFVKRICNYWPMCKMEVKILHG